MWTNKNQIAAIPFGAGCRRIDGGNYYPCPAGITANNSQLPNSARWYVVGSRYGVDGQQEVRRGEGKGGVANRFKLIGCCIGMDNFIAALKGDPDSSHKTPYAY